MPAKSQDPQLPNGLDQNAISGLAQLLCLLLSSLDAKTINLLRFYELQIDFLQRRLHGRLVPNEAERAAFARLAAEIGRPDLEAHVSLFHPETLFRWHRAMISAKFDGSAKRGPGRPSPWRILNTTVQRMALDNPTWGASRIHGHLQALGYGVSRPSVRRIMRRWGLDPDPAPGKRWSDFLARNAAAIVATDFFTYEAWTPVGPRTLYALFFIQLDTRRVHLAGVTEHPDEAWMAQMARNMTMEDEPFLKGRRFLIADRDTKFSASYRNILKNTGLQTLPLPPRSPNLNAFAERWVRTIKEECLDGLLLPGPASVTKAIKEYLLHYHHERPHQGLGNRIPFPVLAHPDRPQHPDQLQRKSRLGGLLNSYCWQGQTPLTSAA